MKASISLAVLCLLGEVSSKHLKQMEPGKFYKPTKPGAKWFELDDPTDRIHGTEHMDNKSPYDPDVDDAPEDLKRVANDHEPLVNPKLSPTGYYNGFFHKDYQGNYAQHNVQRSHKKHHKLAESTLVAFNHENDTEDVPSGLDPY